MMIMIPEMGIWDLSQMGISRITIFTENVIFASFMQFQKHLFEDNHSQATQAAQNECKSKNNHFYLYCQTNGIEDLSEIHDSRNGHLGLIANEHV